MSDGVKEMLLVFFGLVFALAVDLTLMVTQIIADYKLVDYYILIFVLVGVLGLLHVTAKCIKSSSSDRE